MIAQKCAKITGLPPSLVEQNPDGSQKQIKTKKDIRLLSMNLQDNMTWSAHMEEGQDALLPAARKKLGVLKHLGTLIPQKSRKLLTERLVVSKLRYLISIWGGTMDKILSNVQTLLNDVARFVLGKRGRRTSTSTLMEECSWLTVQEMIVQHSLVMLWKTVRLNAPASISEKINIDNSNFLSTTRPRLIHTTNGFHLRAISYWNNLTPQIRALQSLPAYKRQVKNWIIS